MSDPEDVREQSEGKQEETKDPNFIIKHVTKKLDNNNSSNYSSLKVARTALAVGAGISGTVAALYALDSVTSLYIANEALHQMSNSVADVISYRSEMDFSKAADINRLVKDVIANNNDIVSESLKDVYESFDRGIISSAYATVYGAASYALWKVKKFLAPDKKTGIGDLSDLKKTSVKAGAFSASAALTAYLHAADILKVALGPIPLGGMEHSIGDMALYDVSAQIDIPVLPVILGAFAVKYGIDAAKKYARKLKAGTGNHAGCDCG